MSIRLSSCCRCGKAGYAIHEMTKCPQVNLEVAAQRKGMTPQQYEEAFLKGMSPKTYMAQQKITITRRVQQPTPQQTLPIKPPWLK